MEFGTFTSALTLARGPILLIVAVISFHLPHLYQYGWYLKECCSDTKTIVHIILASLGLAWLIQDTLLIIHQTARSMCNNILDNLVLDNVLKRIYDPGTGWIACLTGFFVGTSTMYGFKMTEAQRTTLVQSSLGLPTQEAARSILLEPGGCKALLPEPVQHWMRESPGNGSKHSQAPKSKSSTQDEANCMKGPPLGDISIETNSTTFCDGMDMDCDAAVDTHDVVFDGLSIRRARGLNFVEDDNVTLSSRRRSHTQCSPDFYQRTRHHQNKSSSPNNPLSVFSNILKDLAMQQIIPYVEAFPVSNVENAGGIAAFALGIQFVLRRYSQRNNKLGVLAAMALSIVTTASFGAILTREVILGNVYDKNSLQLTCRNILGRVLFKVKDKVLSHKVKSFLAWFVISSWRNRSTRSINLE